MSVSQLNRAERTKRNERIHELAANGKTQSQIAEALGLTEGTIAGVLSKDRAKDNERKREARRHTKLAAEETASPAVPPEVEGAPPAEPATAEAAPPPSELSEQEAPAAADIATETPPPPSLPTVMIGGRAFTILFPSLLRPHTDAEREDLKTSIQAHGIQVAVVIDEHSGVIDGGNRLVLAAELGLDLGSIPLQVRSGWTEAEKVALALTLNADRRHLTPEQRKQLIAERKQRITEARSKGESIRTIAKQEGIDPKQVQRDLESAGVDMSTPQPEAVKGRDGKRYAAKKPAKKKRREEISHVEPAAEGTPSTTVDEPVSKPPVPQENVAVEQPEPTAPESRMDPSAVEPPAPISSPAAAEPFTHQGVLFGEGPVSDSPYPQMPAPSMSRPEVAADTPVPEPAPVAPPVEEPPPVHLTISPKGKDEWAGENGEPLSIFAKRPGAIRLNLWPDDVDGLVDAVAAVPDEEGRKFLVSLAEAADRQTNIVIGFLERMLAFAPEDRAKFRSKLADRLPAATRKSEPVESEP